TMRVDASTVAVATGGINGDWNNIIDPTGGIATGATGGFISGSKLQAEHGVATLAGDESTYNATKISYYSPRWAGFQFGASYTPDLDATGQFAAR
ncbi:porin, partial [Klebsiella pneumoniae]|uniref:porin n=1 Tax=Klebsiella pneumoniae TaxID=573 RepID=UPI0022704303